MQTDPRMRSEARGHSLGELAEAAESRFGDTSTLLFEGVTTTAAELGTRQSVKRMVAVSEARIPSLCSSRSTSMPGVPFSTTKDLIAARPFDLSSVAHTTTALERPPAVTKIFSPLST